MARFKQDEEDQPYDDDPFGRALRDQMSSYQPATGSVADDPAASYPTNPNAGSPPISIPSGSDASVLPSNESFQPDASEPGGVGTTAAPATDVSQGFASQWAPGATAPSNAPAGYQWDTSLANYAPAPAATGPQAGSFGEVPGFDISKINDLTHVNDKYSPALRVFSQGVAAGVPLTRGDLSAQVQWAKSHGFPNAKQVGDDSIDYGDGHGPIDVIRGDGATMFLDKAVWGSSPATTTAPGSAAAGSFGGLGFGPNDQGAGVGGALINSLVSRLLGGGGIFSGVTGGGSASSSASQDPFRAQLMSALSKLIQEGQQPVGDVSDTPQARAYQLATQRNADKQRSRLAEQRGAQGLLRSGTFEQDKNAVDQQRSQAQAGYEAQLANTILEDRKQKLEYALTTGAGYITNEQQIELQRELQGINAALAQTSIQLQLAQALMSNQRFYDQLGVDVGKTELGANQNAGSAILGG